MEWFHRIHPVSLLYLVVEYPLHRQCVDPPPPTEDTGEDEYQVASVEDSPIY
jgi:hypothetical protein